MGNPTHSPSQAGPRRASNRGSWRSLNAVMHGAVVGAPPEPTQMGGNKPAVSTEVAISFATASSVAQFWKHRGIP